MDNPMSKSCNCTGPPWPPLLPLQVGGLSKFAVCPECRSIREQVFEGPVIADVIWHEEWGNLSKLVRNQAQAALEQHREPEQLSLFEGVLL
jgi:hypothetical protein